MIVSNERRFVIDTSTLLGAVLVEDSIPYKAFYLVLQKGELLISEATKNELAEVLQRKKFDKYLDPEDRTDFFNSLVKRAVLVDITETIIDCRDPKDNKFLELAISGGAEILISSDQDLLDLHPFRQVAIMTPRAFLEQESSAK